MLGNPALNALASFGSGHVPMASSTAACLLIFSVALFGYARNLWRGPGLASIVALTLLATLFSLLVVAGTVVGPDLSLQNALASGAGSLEEIPLGRMSPATGAAMVVAGAGTCLLLPRSWSPRHARRLGDWVSSLGVLTALIGATVLASYLYGAPLMYGGTTVPIAATTALAVLLLGLALVAAAGPQSFPMNLMIGDSTEARLSRAFLPLGLGVVLFQAVLSRLASAAGVHDTLLLAVLIVVVATATAYVVARVSRSIAEILDEPNKMLAQMEDRYRGLLEVAPDAMVVVNGAGEIVLLNLQAEKQFGYHRDELVGQQVTNIIPEGFAERIIADDLRSAADALAQQIGTGVELVALRKDGSEFPIELMLSPLEGSEGILVTAAIRDISVRKAAESHLAQAQKLESVGQLAAGIAHDFNNLLQAIHGYAELLGRSLPDGDPCRTDLDEILRAADRAAELTRQLVAFSRRQILRPRVLDPAEVVEGIVPMLRRLLGEHIALITHKEPGLGHVKADSSQLEQVIVNLAVNARDAMPEGGQLTIETANVELDAEYGWAHPEVSPGRYVLLSFADTGIGMEPDTQARAFEPFFTTKESGNGTGLGLATVYGIVKQSGGSIYLYTEPGRGSTFKIYLPLVEEEPTVETRRPSLHPATTGSETILLVEDNAAVRAFARRVLEEPGYTVLEAASGAAALMLAASGGRSIDLLVTDVVMPGVQGHQLAERLWADRPDMPVLYISGFTETSVISHGISRHRVSFLPKPFTAEALALAVRHILDEPTG